MRRFLLAILLIIVSCSAHGQMLLHPGGPLPSFEVATIKPGTYWAGSGPLGSSSTLWLTIPKMTMREFIAGAYGQFLSLGYTSPRVYGGPNWLDRDHYSMQVKIPEDIFLAMKTMPEEQKLQQLRLMEQSLLERRFHLKVHFEMREIPVYELHVAKGGMKLKPDEPGDLPSSSGSAASSKGVKIGIKHVTMEELCDKLIGYVNRPVVDKTMLDGRYTLQLLISPIGTDYEGMPSNRSGLPFDPSGDAPTLSTALKDLGFQLVPAKGQEEVVIIDSIDPPTEN